MPTERKSRRGLVLTGVLVAIVLLLVVGNGIWTRNLSQGRLQEQAALQSVPTVGVVTPAHSANQSSLDLPGRLEAYARAPTYARVGGFRKAWYVDIGAPVKAGQLM